MEKLTWFKFTISDWIMGKIMKCPEITQARFLRLCCLYWNKECFLSIDDTIIEIDKEHFDILVSKKVISISDEMITIRFLDEQNENVISLSEKRRLAVLERWNKLKNKNTSVPKKHTSVLQNDTDKSRVDKSILNTNSIDDRKLKFSKSLVPFVGLYGKEMIRDFCDYWTEPNKSKTKFKQETQKTWDTSLRLKRWASSDFNKSKTPKVYGAIDQSNNKDLFK